MQKIFKIRLVAWKDGTGYRLVLEAVGRGGAQLSGYYKSLAELLEAFRDITNFSQGNLNLIEQDITKNDGFERQVDLSADQIQALANSTPGCFEKPL